MITAQGQLTNYLENFAAFATHAPGRDLPWLKALREDAFARFCEVGIPTQREEDWRFTNMSTVAQTAFRLPDGRGAKLSPAAVESFRFPGAACLLVFVDGRFAPELSQIGGLPKGLEVASIAQKLASDPGALEPHIGRYLDTQRDAFSALNTAFLADGGYVRAAPGTVAAEPVHLLFVSTAAEVPLMTHPRNLIVAGENSHVTVLEEYVSLGSAVALSNTATELVAADNAVVSHYMLEREDTRACNVSTLRIQQGRGANIASHSVLVGGAIVRNNVHPVLAGEGGECLINGLFIGRGRQHLDNYMLVEHAKPRCGSRQFYNGILDDHAHGVFHGRIIVHKDAQKTDAKQTNRNLLLSDNAQIDTKPQLEIYADDVKCTHGATIGQIEEDAVFYLRSRGIDTQSARRMLLVAFASECLDRMARGPARTYVEGLINDYVLGWTALSAAARPSSGSPSPTARNWSEVG